MRYTLEKTPDIAVNKSIDPLRDVIEQPQRVTEEVYGTEDLRCLTFQLLRVVELDEFEEKGTRLKLVVVFKWICNEVALTVQQLNKFTIFYFT